MSSFAHFPRVQWQRNAPPGVHRRCLRAFLWPPKTLFSMRTFAAVCARVHGVFWRECPGTPRVKPSGKSRLFSDRGPCLFSVRGFVRLHGCGRGLSPVVVFQAQGGKAVSPASASPWRTPANRCRTRLFSAPNSPAFRGSQQPLGAFPLEEPTRNFPPVCMN